jgi:hypothetical protein
LERVRADQAVAAARQVARVSVIAETTEAALLAVSHVSALESLLVSRTPRAEERLRHIADAGALGMTEVVLSRTPRAEERLRHIADAGALGMTEVVLSINRQVR